MHIANRLPFRSRGLTLIEVMIVMMIVGIMAASAIPSYTSYTRKGNRAAAQSYMMIMASRQGDFLIVSNTYATESELKAVLPVPEPVKKFYTVTMTTTTTPPAFKITATPIVGSKQVPDGELSLDNAGNRLPAAKW